MPTIFETERLIVRDWDPEQNAEVAYSLYSNPVVMRFLGGEDKMPGSIEIQRERLSLIRKRYADLGDGTGYWAIEEKASGFVVGASILKQLPEHEMIEVGWHLLPEHWGKGYATESARGALRYGFNILGHLKIVAVVRSENEASIRVTQRLGMEPEGTVQAYDMELRLFAKSREDNNEQ